MPRRWLEFQAERFPQASLDRAHCFRISASGKSRGMVLRKSFLSFTVNIVEPAKVNV